jgi:hypothetical protein
MTFTTLNLYSFIIKTDEPITKILKNKLNITYFYALDYSLIWVCLNCDPIPFVW